MSADAQGTTFIYALADPDTGEVCYVGKSNNPKKRLWLHMKPSHQRTARRGEWLRGLKAAGKRPTLLILEEVGIGNWQAAERKWIQYFREQGAPLTNMDDGGKGSTTTSPENREKARRRMKAFWDQVKAEHAAEEQEIIDALYQSGYFEAVY